MIIKRSVPYLQSICNSTIFDAQNRLFKRRKTHTDIMNNKIDYLKEGKHTPIS